MKAEQYAYLEAAQSGNQANSYGVINGLGIGDSLALQVLRDWLGLFKLI